jgi:pimeloyl-ACP methyl ester carboxylesterase
MNTLILLPGALGNVNQFNSLKQELSLVQANVITIDLPGHGLNPYATEAVTVPEIADAFLNQLHKLEISGPIQLFGHSLGGYIGLYLCLHYPEKITGLFTLGTKWHWTKEIADRETSFLVPEIMEQKIPAFVNHLKISHSIGWQKVVINIAHLMHDLGNNGYLEPAKLSTINQPVRVALGDRDAMVGLDETINVYKALPNSQLQIYPNTPHPFEKSDVVKLAADIKSFFNL